MTYYLAPFNIETCDLFADSSRDVVGYPISYRSKAKAVRPGDRLVAYCYWPKFFRWLGILEVLDNYYTDDSLWLGEENNPIRLKVRALVWLPPEKSVPVQDKSVWDYLQFTKEMDPSLTWFGGKLARFPDADGLFLERLLIAQDTGGDVYPVDEEQLRKRRDRMQKIRERLSARREGANKEAAAKSPAPELPAKSEKAVPIAIPDDDRSKAISPAHVEGGAIRESAQIQALLALCGEKMGFKIWLPKNDRPAVLQQWVPEQGSLLEGLPLNYDFNTLRTIENIDVLWIRGSAIARAFEIEHTTAVYSGLLRMADLLAMQPNMRIHLHIVAPEDRRKKVFQEIIRPVFSLLEGGPLSDCCSFIGYASILELSQNPHLQYLTDSVLEKYEQFVT